jgi:hypothetical protein
MVRFFCFQKYAFAQTLDSNQSDRIGKFSTLSSFLITHVQSTEIFFRDNIYELFFDQNGLGCIFSRTHLVILIRIKSFHVLIDHFCRIVEKNISVRWPVILPPT